MERDSQIIKNLCITHNSNSMIQQVLEAKPSFIGVSKFTSSYLTEQQAADETQGEEAIVACCIFLASNFSLMESQKAGMAISLSTSLNDGR